MLQHTQTTDHDNRLSKIQSDLLILKWMVGLVIIVTTVPILRVVFAMSSYYGFYNPTLWEKLNLWENQ